MAHAFHLRGVLSKAQLECPILGTAVYDRPAGVFLHALTLLAPIANRLAGLCRFRSRRLRKVQSAFCVASRASRNALSKLLRVQGLLTIPLRPCAIKSSRSGSERFPLISTTGMFGLICRNS